MQPLHALLPLLVVACIAGARPCAALHASPGVPCSPNPFPVMWNVQGAFNDSQAVEAFGIESAHLTLTGHMGGAWPRIRGSHVENGGVPQAANWTQHEAALVAGIRRRVPASFRGFAVFDFEDWVPAFDLNRNADWWHSRVYQTHSEALVKAAHPTWSSARVLFEARRTFNEAALSWMVRTLEVAKRERPLARWGYYGFPASWDTPCVLGKCGYDVPVVGAALRAYSDAQRAVYNASDVLFPSAYVFRHLSTPSEVESYVRSTVREARRVAAGKPVYAFMMPQFHDLSALLPKETMQLAMDSLAGAGADGCVMWGYEPKPSTAFPAYVRTVLGPMVHALLERLCKAAE